MQEIDLVTKDNNTPDIDTAIAFYNLHKDKDEIKTKIK